MRVLKKADKGEVIPLLEAAIVAASGANDFIWLAWIKHFLTFAEIDRLDFADQGVYDLLQYAEW